MIVKGFYDLKRGGYVDLVVKDIFFEFEKYFCKMYLRVEILGKKGWKVFVLFMKVMQINIELFFKKRLFDFEYLFVWVNNSCFYYRGFDSIREFVFKCGVKYVDFIIFIKF